MFHHHSWEPDGEPGGGGVGRDTHWDSNIMFIHTGRKQDDAPWWLVMFQVCLIKLAAFMNDVFSV